MVHLPPLIEDLGIILITAAVTTLIFKRLKQPVVLGYIVLGSIALKRGRTKGQRAAAFAAALALFGYIVLVAITKRTFP